MEAVLGYMHGLFSAEGRELTATVLRHVMLYVAPLLMLHLAGGRVLFRRVRTLHDTAQKALEEARYEDAVRACEALLRLADIWQPLYRFRMHTKRCYRLLGDALLGLGRFQFLSAVPVQ